MALIRYGDMTKHGLVFPSTCLSPYAFPGMEYKKNICWFHISNYTQVGEKTILHF